MGRTTTNPPLAIYPQTTPRGQQYIEVVITGDAATHLARAVARRVHGQHLARSVGHEVLVTLIAGAITDRSIELTPTEAENLATDLLDVLDDDTTGGAA